MNVDHESLDLQLQLACLKGRSPSKMHKGLEQATD